MAVIMGLVCVANLSKDLAIILGSKEDQIAATQINIQEHLGNINPEIAEDAVDTVVGISVVDLLVKIFGIVAICSFIYAQNKRIERLVKPILMFVPLNLLNNLMLTIILTNHVNQYYFAISSSIFQIFFAIPTWITFYSFKHQLNEEQAAEPSDNQA